MPNVCYKPFFLIKSIIKVINNGNCNTSIAIQHELSVLYTLGSIKTTVVMSKVKESTTALSNKNFITVIAKYPTKVIPMFE